MKDRTRLITDSSEKHKLLVSLPGGRYQLSLDDSAVVFLTDTLDYGRSKRKPRALARGWIRWPLHETPSIAWP